MFKQLFCPKTNSARKSLDYWQGEATVEEEIQPSRIGRVYFRGTWWKARCEENVTLCSGETVEVVGHNNITLIVKPSSGLYHHHRS